MKERTKWWLTGLLLGMLADGCCGAGRSSLAVDIKPGRRVSVTSPTYRVLQSRMT
jgi:hypothetical protein